MSIQLAATGQADVYITGTPSVTYFSSVYRQATPFVKQTFEIPFDNKTLLTSGSGICTIPAQGDIIADITLKATLPVLNQPSTNYTFYWPSTATTNVQMYADYATLTGPVVTNGFGYLFLSVPQNTTTTGGTFPLTGGYWALSLPNYGSPVSTTAYSTLFTVSFNPTTLAFTISCPTSTNPALFTIQQFNQYVIESNGSGMLNPQGGALPLGIQFFDQTSANFFGFSTINTVYPFVNGNVTGGPISQSGWIFGNGLVPNTNYYDDVGARLISQARFLVGGQTISTLTGQYLDLMKDIDVAYENQVALTQLMGKNDSTSVVLPRNLYTQLTFGIDNIPICALSKQDVQVQIDFNPLLSAQLTTSNALSASILVEFVYIGDNERTWLTNKRQTYVYESMMTRSLTVQPGDNIIKLDKYFLNPVKELYIILQTSATTYQYANTLTNAVLLFNGQELINYPSTYFQTMTPFLTKPVMPTRNMYMYSFNGPVNFSRISDIKLRLSLSSGPYTCIIYAKTLNVFVSESDIGGFIFM